MTEKIHRSHYLTKPAVWRDDRPLGARETTRSTSQVSIGDLIVFDTDARNAYQVGVITRLDMPEIRATDPTGRNRDLIRFDCGDGISGSYPNPAGFWDGDQVTILETPEVVWEHGETTAELTLDGEYVGYVAKISTNPGPMWWAYRYDTQDDVHRRVAMTRHQWMAERRLLQRALRLDPGDDYRLTLPDGRRVHLTTLDRITLASLVTLATRNNGDELKVDTGRTQVWIAHGTREWSLPGLGNIPLTDAIYMRERPNTTTDQWDTTSIWQ